MKRLLACITILALLLPALPSLAQGNIFVNVDDVDTSSFPNVRLHVTVRNQYGVPVADLDQIELAITEDGDAEARPLVGRPARRQNEEFPMTVVVALDVSGSMAGAPLAEAKKAALNFLKQLEYGGGRAGLIAFSDSIDLDPGVDPRREHPVTGDFAALYALIDGLQARGWTPLYDTAYKAVRWAAAEPPGTRAVLLLTDGREQRGSDGKSGSRVANEDSAILEANLSNVPIFTIGLKNADLNEPFLERLARQTGGTYQLAPDAAQLDSLFQTVAGQLRQQVRVTYQSAVPADGKEHVVRVEARVRGYTGFHQAKFLVPAVAPPAPLLIVDVDRVDASRLPEVTLEVSIRDGQGQPMTGIAAESITVTEDGESEARPLTAVEAGGEGRLRIAYISGLEADGREHSVEVTVSLPDGPRASDKVTFAAPVPPPPPALVLTLQRADAGRFPAVRLEMTVADEEGTPIDRLGAADLTVTEDGQAVGSLDNLESAGQGRYALGYQSALPRDGKGHTVQVEVRLPDGRSAWDKVAITTPAALWQRPEVVGGGLGGLLVLVLGGLAARRAAARKMGWVYRCMDCGHDLEEGEVPCPACNSTRRPFRVRARRTSSGAS